MTIQPIRFAIQSSGRLRTDSLSFVTELGVDLPLNNNRSLVLRARTMPVEVIFLRHSDIPRYVASGDIDYAIVGDNVLYEQSSKVIKLQSLNFGHCNLVIAVPQYSLIKRISDLTDQRIATAYPRSLEKFLSDNNITASVIPIRGSVEATPQLNLADAICDLTQTGTTLRLHRLEPLQVIFSSQAVLIQSPIYLPSPLDPIAKFLQHQYVATR
ncbi:MAG: ATP phosphoribosyltransferase [Candidatus Kerfeldbacteria bacterium]|nr:ATP phosphoribosyltransferase [Candidatus Kerfeldbacteria bacterium]